METARHHILENILKTITDSDSPDQSMGRIVRMIAEGFSTDVCSVYAYNPYANALKLKATVGLSPESVDAIEMDVHEGLTGLVIETMAPVFIKNPAAHPRYKFYQGSGEEEYHTYLGVPLIYHKKILGALVVQTRTEEGIAESDIPLLGNIARQIAATVAFIILQDDRRVVDDAKPPAPARSKTDDHRTALGENHLRGEAVSDQVTFGHAHLMLDTIEFDHIHPATATDTAAEMMRLEQAFDRAAAQIEQVAARAQSLSEQDKAIIEAHLMFLSDKSLRQKIAAGITRGESAEYALKLAVLQYVDLFKSMDDPYLRERYADVMDIGRRVLGNLVGINDRSDQAFARDTIIIAADISPVDLMAIRQPHLKGVVLAQGGRTSHTVIMAKSLEIPIVIGVENVFAHVRDNDFLIVDGVSGMVYVNPAPDIRKEYERRQAENRQVLKKLEGLRDLPAETEDGFTVRLGANIGLLSDLMLAREYGADHIGLYRTEFPFLLRKAFPSEEEQVNLYARALQKAEGRTLTIRTFDVGGDKFLPYLDYPREDNPFLGWRAIRLSLDLEEVFRAQIRAILRASALGKTRILFPMITEVEEVRRVAALVAEEKQRLDSTGIGFDSGIELGIMVEVPAAVPILDRLLHYADFVNIGTNDLVQYLLAVDRNNKKVARHFNALHPAVIATVDQILSVCRRYGKQACICGEAASIRECIFLFVGMGADHLSMVPSAIPAAKAFIRSIRRVDAESALQACLKMETGDEIKSFIAARLASSV
ncbi:MAG: phosphoenolpyruvate--protein phosphotransferase [Thermodesulfobacteriota bacterium]